MIEARVAGIPCLIEVVSVRVVAPDPGADSDWDHRGYSEVEFEVCDRRGRPAPWLERKMTDADRQEIETLILEEHRDDN